MFLSLIVATILGCAQPEAPKSSALDMPKGPAKSAVAAKPKTDAEKTVLDIALGSPDHSTLVAAVSAAGLADALGSPGGIYTVFAPTTAAFEKLPVGTVEGLLKPEKKGDLKKIIQHHAAVPIVPMAQMQDGGTLTMADGTKVTFKREGDKVTVEGANILGTVNAVNGVVYVVDSVILPPA